MLQNRIASIVTEVVRRAPQWVRHDMASTDAAVRTRAEETLAAMIVAALIEKGGDAAPLP